ncbi:unnamed protein product [Cuscuta epithymum]|uniref:Secreted protein n=1 Tax=Cuscuta epithymum TaxID=186058 RepID=A0AAV0C9L9_9ASTE|nr:unnamed protein product [Cuscuta epithymum]
MLLLDAPNLHFMFCCLILTAGLSPSNRRREKCFQIESWDVEAFLQNGHIDGKEAENEANCSGKGRQLFHNFHMKIFIFGACFECQTFAVDRIFSLNGYKAK